MADGAHAAAEQADIRQIAGALGLTKRPAERRATRDAWPFIETTTRGGRKRLYPIASLPADVQEALRHQRALAAAQAAAQSPTFREGLTLGRRLAMAEQVDAAVVQRQREAGTAAAAGLTGHKRARMEARMDLLNRLDAYAQSRGLGVCAAMQQFCAAFRSGALQVPLATRHLVGPDLHPATLRRWRKALDTQGLAALAGNYGNRAGSGVIESNQALRELAIGLIAAKPHISGRQLYRAMTARFPEAGLALRTVQRFLDRWKRENAQVFLAVANPDAWKNKHMLALGRASEDVVRLNQRWEFDSTPGDVQLEDGRHTILGVIDIWSRRLKLTVHKTSSAEGVCRALRRCLLDWGVPEEAKVDNGQDYVSHRVQTALRGLGCDIKLSAPFSPWEKPHIERAFRTFSHDLLELLPGYLGHSVAEQQAQRAQKSFAERLFKKGQTVELRMTAAELQAFCDRWTDQLYAHEARDGLGGLTVFERVASWRGEVRRVGDARALDLLLAEMPDGKGGRTITKKGLRLDGHLYLAPEFGALVGERVQVRYDEGDMGRVVVYHDERFVCVAECPELLGVSRREVAIEAKARQAQEIQEKRRELKALGRKARAADIVQDILDAKAAEAAALSALPAPNIVHLTPALEAAQDAAAALDGTAPSMPAPVTAAEVIDVVELVRAEQRQDETAETRFRRALEQLLRIEQLNDIELRQLKNYQQSPEFRGRWQLLEDFGAKPMGLPEAFDALLTDHDRQRIQGYFA